MIKALFITFLLFAFYGNARCFGQSLAIPAVPVYQVPAYSVAVPVAVPAVVYRPQVQYVPYQLDRTVVTQKAYRTPLRNLFFGRYRVQHYYAPQQQVQQ